MNNSEAAFVVCVGFVSRLFATQQTNTVIKFYFNFRVKISVRTVSHTVHFFPPCPVSRKIGL